MVEGSTIKRKKHTLPSWAQYFHQALSLRMTLLCARLWAQ